ncbi:hypothetical protein C8A03DRAFT_30080 [Achaetomium macrosporum]|uniref:LysM domain-containing protein n=1 Tax=Achaetomium macrosporum TaxID=79813 RepID=A0AAN7HH34_9PEZI|nr:hypothetical protein C8A03DRAFT_30080 [Achaetomium macrosporum]
MDIDAFLSWNPSLAPLYNATNPDACTLQPGYRYCSSGRRVKSSSTSSTSSSSLLTGSGTGTRTSTSTRISTGIRTPSPIQSGMVGNCNKFYLVQPNDGCWAIAKSNGIALADFYSWNPAVGRSCTALYPGAYVCIGVSPTPTPTTTAPSTGVVATPTPTQVRSPIAKPDMMRQCGDGCWNIAKAEGISLDNLYAWNPALHGDCSGLWPTYYICIGVSSRVKRDRVGRGGNGI